MPRRKAKDEAMTRFAVLVLAVMLGELGTFLYVAGGIRPLG